jgi:oxalate decarboxylase/phosphoglucose isomerase-like protein (cupin superfamily)
MQQSLCGVIGGDGPILMSMAPLPADDEPWPVPPGLQSPHNPTWKFLALEPKIHYGGSYIQQLFQSTFSFSADMSGEHDVIIQGAVRTIHWHTNAGELSYVVKGELDFTVVSFGGASKQARLKTGDVGWAPMGFSHSFTCVSESFPCEVLLVWNAGNLGTIELAPWISMSPPTVVASNLNISEAELRAFKTQPIFSPGRSDNSADAAATLM